VTIHRSSDVPVLRVPPVVAIADELLATPDEKLATSRLTLATPDETLW
jgi:hypothetical protein